jgi:murein L,D-transpeptidase YcbB/YkuD
VSKDVREFYERRDFASAWVTQDDGSRAHQAMTVIDTAPEHGLDAADYDTQNVTRLLDTQFGEDPPKGDARTRARQLAEIDTRITTALLSLGRDVALGRTKPQQFSSLWKARRQPPDFVGTLTSAADLTTWLDTIRPRHPEYVALQKELASLRAQRQQGVTQQGDGTIDDRIAIVEANLDRWRWLPDDLGARHLLVNIPSFHLVARENGQTVLEMKVVVGKPDQRTPVFSDEMTTIVFSPYWNVPDSIVEGETAPAAARDPSFLARNNIEILRRSKSGTTTVDPSTVNWDDPEELKALAFRQKPGSKNALGHVKFLFPNTFDVYLHDTPADQLFARTGRAFSHGCVRVEQPEALAKWVMQDAPEWDDARIAEAMHAGVEKHVALEQAIPVHIVYFTVWMDQTGAAHYEPDVYGYDAKARVNLAVDVPQP